MCNRLAALWAVIRLFNIMAETGNDTAIGRVPAERIVDIIDAIRPLLERVIKPDTGYTVESVIYDAIVGASHLWVIGDFTAIVITRFQDRPAERILWVEWMAGKDLDRWVQSWFDAQAEFARANHCAAVEFHGRMGYKRYEKLLGNVKPVKILYRQELIE